MGRKLPTESFRAVVSGYYHARGWKWYATVAALSNGTFRFTFTRNGRVFIRTVEDIDEANRLLNLYKI